MKHDTMYSTIREKIVGSVRYSFNVDIVWNIQLLPMPTHIALKDLLNFIINDVAGYPQQSLI